MKYKCNDVFMLRTPSLPIDQFLSLLEHNGLVKDFIKYNNIDNFIKESLLISSKDLYKSLEKRNLSPKKIRNLNISLMKYITRVSTRPTPYGLFAGVALGKFSNMEDETKLIIDENKVIRDAKVDNKWIFNLICKLEKEQCIVNNLQVKFNNICYLFKGRIKNPYISNYSYISKSEKYIDQSSIRYTALVDFIKDNTQSFIAYNKLKSKILLKYDGVSHEVVDKTLNMLIENEYLITDLRTPAYCANNLLYLIEQLKENKKCIENTEKLENINRLITSYKSNVNFLSEDNTLQNIFELMAKLNPSKDYLEVNKGLYLEKNCLNTKIKKKLENFANSICELSIDRKNFSTLETFKNRFQEVYGLNTEVSLSEVIDPNAFNGLELIRNSTSHLTDKEVKIRDIVDEKIMLAIANKKEIVELTKEDFSEIISNYPVQNYCKSFDINMYITKKNESINLTIGPNIGSSKAGKMFQRFSDVLDKELMKEYNKIYQKEITLTEDEYILVEARELSLSGRANNVVNKFKNHEYFLPIALAEKDTNNQIYIEDLFIGLSFDENLYIKSKSNNKICKIITDNMLNQSSNGKLLRLLREISDNYEEKIIDRITSLYNNNYVYIPRIKFEGITIQGKKWLFSDNMLELENKDVFKNCFYKYVEIYNIDSLIYLCDKDNRLVLNIFKEESIDIIYSFVKKTRNLELVELENGLLDDSIIEDKCGRKYVNEFVFSFILNEKNKRYNKVNNDDYVKKNLSIDDDNRIIPPFKHGWIYVKLYGMGKRENEVLAKMIEELNKLEKTKFFYIRYLDDNGKHLRIRFKNTSETQMLNTFISLNNWLNNMLDEGLINRWAFDTYEREINRYGGKQLIDLAEEIFFIDSEFTINLLNLIDLENEAELEKAYISGMCSMLRYLTNDFKEMFDVVNSIEYPEEYKKIFRENRKKYIEIVDNECIGNLELADKIYKEMQPLIVSRAEYLNNFKKELDHSINEKNNTNYKNNLILSLIHMYCNRLTGKKEYEEKFLALIRHSLYAILERKKHLKNI